MQYVQLNKIYFLDLGSTPTQIKTLEYTSDGVKCEYLDSTPGHVEIIDFELFKINGFMKPKILFNPNEIYAQYKDNPSLKEADMFQLYDTGVECATENQGYHDSRFFKVVAFNSITMEKRAIENRDGLSSFSDDLCIRKIRVYADGSFFISLNRLAGLDVFQCVKLK